MKKWFLLGALMVFPAYANAACDAVDEVACYCSDLTITDIKADNDKVLVLYERSNGALGGWHLLAPFSHPSVNYKLAIALTAKSSGSKVSMSFPVADGACDYGNKTVQSINIEIN